LRKNAEGDFTLLVASVDKQSPATSVIDSSDPKLTLRLEYGDYSAELARCVAALREASKHVEGNAHREKMLEVRARISLVVDSM
jgi:dipeptidyl-peptidase-3